MATHVLQELMVGVYPPTQRGLRNPEHAAPGGPGEWAALSSPSGQEPGDTAPTSPQLVVGLGRRPSCRPHPRARVSLPVPSPHQAGRLLCVSQPGGPSRQVGASGGAGCQEISSCSYIRPVISGGSFWTFAQRTLLRRQERGYKTLGPVSRCHLGENLSGLLCPLTAAL